MKHPKYIALPVLLLVVWFFCKPCFTQNKFDSVAAIKNIGNEILNGANISKYNEKDIYRLIHNVLAKDSVERNWYFKVFIIIRKQATKYLAEDIDFYSKDFCLMYPNDFFALSNDELKSLATDIGEIIRTEEESPSQYLEEYISKIKAHSSLKYLNKINNFNDDLRIALKK